MNKHHHQPILLLFIVFLVTIFFGLRPKGFDFVNNVRWLPDRSGIHFDANSIAFTKIENIQSKKNCPGVSNFSAEIAIEPKRLDYNKVKVILALHGGADSDQLIIGQWQSYIIVINGADYSQKYNAKVLEAKMPISALVPVLISLATGHKGTQLYFNGQSVDSVEIPVVLPKGDQVLVTLGNSVYGMRPWQGNVLGVALYDHELSPEAIKSHFNQWASAKKFNPANDDKPILNYLLDEKMGTMARNHAGNDHHLVFPAWKPVLKKIVLDTQLTGFQFNQVILLDVVINVIGFMPLGFCLSTVSFSCGTSNRKRSILLSTGVCLVISLGMEITQAWIPSRSSQLLDVLMNTFGAFIGAKIKKSA